MGLLDDAIREHLDLKRRRGADPAEIERAERDALGPVRRGPEEPQLETSHETADVRAPAAGPEFAEPEYPDEPFADDEPELDWDEAPGHAQDTAFSAPPAPVPAPPPFEDTPPRPELFEDDEAFADEPPRRGPMPTHSEETAEYDVETALSGESPDVADPRIEAGERARRGGEPAPGEKSEDVLEETPDFLQDTPDHDRLWFEQKPPRDFDFDR